jgi:tripeptide aminopeptidase
MQEPKVSERFNQELEERLVRYAAIDSQSDETTGVTPSTDCQWDMLRLMEQELNEIGASDVVLTDYAVVLATIPGNIEGPTIGWLAHVDTAPQFNATGVKPRVIRAYDGGDITYPDNPDLVLSPKDHPYLGTKQGHDIITASGTTLLGADDKAGIAIIMAMAGHFLRNPDIPRPTIRIAFTPDEEIGVGFDDRLARDLKADFAYTLDGGVVGEIIYESFSADRAVVRVEGVSIHPGYAKDKMVNAIHLASKIIDTLPQVTMTPEVTSGHEGFIHATDMSGGSTEMELKFILRDYELDGLAAKGALLRQVCDVVQAAEPRAKITCEIHPQYRNMRYWLEKDMTPVDLARSACADNGIDVLSVPIRGGTDGSRLTEMGVPTPNIFTGMQCIHGPKEWVSVQDMAQATEVCITLMQQAAKG